MKVNNFKINGSKIAAYKISGVRMISVSVLVKAGAWYEKENEAGLFHLLEHLMMTGTKKFPSFKDISEYKEKYGINCGASTSRSKMGYWFDFPDIYLEEAFELIKEILFYSRVNFDNFNNESEIVRQEYLDAWNDPYRKIDNEIENKFIGKGCNLINDVLGKPEIFMSVKREKLKSLYESFFKPERMCFGISGNYKHENLVKILKNSIPKTLNKTVTELEIKKFSPNYGTLRIRDNKIKQASGRIIWEINKIEHKDLITNYSLNMLNYLFGSGPNSALFYRIRQEKGLVYQINSTYWNWPNSSYFEIYFSCEEKKINEVITESLAVLDRQLNNKISSEKHQQVMRYLNLGTLMSFNSPSKIAYKLASSLFYEGKALSAKEINKIASGIDLNDYQKKFREQINKNQKLEVSILPKLD